MVDAIAKNKSSLEFLFESIFEIVNPTTACPKIEAITLCFLNQ